MEADSSLPDQLQWEHIREAAFAPVAQECYSRGGNQKRNNRLEQWRCVKCAE